MGESSLPLDSSVGQSSLLFREAAPKPPFGGQQLALARELLLAALRIGVRKLVGEPVGSHR